MREIRERKSSNKTNIRYRFLSLTCNEQVQLKLLKKYIFACAVAIRVVDNLNIAQTLLSIQRKCAQKYLSIKYGANIRVQIPIRPRITIASLSESSCLMFYQFRKEDLIRLFQLLILK